jgi:hypothetical protein
MLLGIALGDSKDTRVLVAVGTGLGVSVGISVGVEVGDSVAGAFVGCTVGVVVGRSTGMVVTVDVLAGEAVSIGKVVVRATVGLAVIIEVVSSNAEPFAQAPTKNRIAISKSLLILHLKILTSCARCSLVDIPGT